MSWPGLKLGDVEMRARRKMVTNVKVMRREVDRVGGRNGYTYLNKSEEGKGDDDEGEREDRKN
jgi:hypothetical protein